MDIQIIEMILGLDRAKYGVNAISLVEEPAIEADFLALSKEVLELAKVDEEKRILLGAVLIPDKPILRKKDDGTPYYIYFKKETIEETAHLYMLNGNNANTRQDHNKDIENVTIVETWLTSSSDKSKDYGMVLPQGSWVVMMKVNDDALWNDYIKTGKLKGFSIEGYFTSKENVEMSKEEVEDDDAKQKYEDLKELLKKL